MSAGAWDAMIARELELIEGEPVTVSSQADEGAPEGESSGSVGISV
jgi:hypothetical protein